FSGVGGCKAEEQQQKKTVSEEQDKKIEDAILYIDRIYRLGQQVENLEGYDIWKAWKDNKIGAK
ncbi:TPA: hypothetical protein SIC23_002255, partial [Pasteurella multocida]|nr:hypothetical protein [Pasteurella multocida]